jgi:hypothetical protein
VDAVACMGGCTRMTMPMRRRTSVGALGRLRRCSDALGWMHLHSCAGAPACQGGRGGVAIPVHRRARVDAMA